MYTYSYEIQSSPGLFYAIPRDTALRHLRTATRAGMRPRWRRWRWGGRHAVASLRLPIGTLWVNATRTPRSVSDAAIARRTPRALASLASRLEASARRHTVCSHETHAARKRLARRCRLAVQRSGRAQEIYIAAVGLDRCYGGPEEGGWYYDASHTLAVRRAFGWRDALAHARELRAEYPTCPRGRGSVLGGTDVYLAVAASVAGLPADDCERPRYE